jgi:hypothetical protein
MLGLAAMPPTDGQTDGRTDRIPKFNTSLIGRGKNEYVLEYKIHLNGALYYTLEKV